MTKECKIFLISSVSYDNEKVDRYPYIDVMRSFLKTYPVLPEGHQAVELAGADVFYSESDGVADFSNVKSEVAVEMARNFNMCMSGGFPDYQPPEYDSSRDIFSIKSCDVNLFYDSHAFFSIIYEVTLCLSENISQNDFIESIFKGRELYKNLGIDDFARTCQQVAMDKVRKLIESAGAKVEPGAFSFQSDNTLPLLMFSEPFPVDREKFKNEEVMSEVATKSLISEDYDGSFFHPGWNYTIAVGFPEEVFINILQFMIRAQSFFFSLGYMKAYYDKELSKTVTSKHKISGKDVEVAEDVQLAFHSLVAQFNSYQNKLFPKYCHELGELMIRWRCDRDVENIRSYNEMDLRAKEKIHAANLEKQNDRQNKALTFIALVQLVSIYGAFADGYAIHNDSQLWFYVGTVIWTFSVMVYLVVSRYFRWAIAYLVGSVLCFGIFWYTKQFPVESLFSS